MEKNVELEFINKVRELSEKMQDLNLFWQSNLEVLKDINECKFSESLDDLTVSPEDTNICKNYPSCDSFDKLTLNIYSWLLTLINNYCEKDPIVFFDAYYKSLYK